MLFGIINSMIEEEETKLLIGALLKVACGRCIWFENCSQSPYLENNADKWLNCAYDGEAKEAPLLKLERICPHLDPSEGVCCSEKQLDVMEKNFNISASILGRCPTCLHNFKKNFCAMTCHPQQSYFLQGQVMTSNHFETQEEVSVISNVTYYVADEFVQRVYDSCKNVVTPSVSGTALKLMCGKWGDKLCSPYRWFRYLGSLSNGFTPFQIDYVFSGETRHHPIPEGIQFYNTVVESCDVGVNGSEPCSCADCESAWSIIFLAIVIASKILKTQSNLSNGSSNHEGQILSYVSLSIAIGLCTGIFWLNVTTDPIELWASPSSRSRVERDFFDKTFRPFYRITQVIVKAKNLSSFKYDDFLGETKSFGPIFHKEEFLFPLLELQKNIENIKTKENGITLKDICHAPLEPISDVCNIQNIWSYWQDNQNELEKIEFNSDTNHNDTYLDHFIVCSRNPTTSQAENTDETILYVEGPNPEEIKKLEKALEWEKAYVEFMLEWTKNPENTKYMDIAFTSERSIEDELAKETYGDISTIAVSYIIMFIYITFSLGEKYNVEKIYGRKDPRGATETHVEHVGRIVGEVAPSMLLTSVTESTCFFLGAISDMPAVRAFALYAGMALLIDFLMQVTCFISLISLDMARQNDNYYDIICCVRGSKKNVRQNGGEGVVYKLFKHFYAPFVMKEWVRAAVVIIFFGWFCTSLAVTPRIEVGLDQKLSMPDDSFVLKYFTFIEKYLSVGPPVYFVVDSSNVDLSLPGIQNKFCGGAGCSDESLNSLINLWSKQPEKTYIAAPAQSWIDDYLAWTIDDSCCKYRAVDMSVCQSNGEMLMILMTMIMRKKKRRKATFYYYEDEDDNQNSVQTKKGRSKRATDSCIKCPNSDDAIDLKRPGPKAFRRYMKWFLEDNPGERCPKAGHAAYSQSVRLKAHPQKDNESFFQYNVIASNFMTFHTILKTPKDYYEALRWARRLSSEIENSINGNLTDKSQGVHDSDQFNGNDVFLEHFSKCCQSRKFSHGSCMEETKILRAKSTIINMGSSVLSGITLTKFGGIIVLAFANSQIFSIFLLSNVSGNCTYWGCAWPHISTCSLELYWTSHQSTQDGNDATKKTKKTGLSQSKADIFK
ncbi:NPC1 [Lepeophtheirus salmonis]|uniref:NPC1 n=1 Tax=Lepeophtheirus salmonis TaxID=72036 RepID=A0A7R8CZ52_LEPSM|nr:NPC1 [Lepeophtheirus salmonis]CAF2946978.1 NPC1 [Lepeophtheirus salmonis]